MIRWSELDKHERLHVARDFELRIESAMSQVPLLPERDVQSVRRMFEGNEWGLALEILCTQICEWGIRVRAETVRSLESLSDDMGIDLDYTDLLREELMDP